MISVGDNGSQDTGEHNHNIIYINTQMVHTYTLQCKYII